MAEKPVAISYPSPETMKRPEKWPYCVVYIAICPIYAFSLHLVWRTRH